MQKSPTRLDPTMTKKSYAISSKYWPVSASCSQSGFCRTLCVSLNKTLGKIIFFFIKEPNRIFLTWESFVFLMTQVKWNKRATLFALNITYRSYYVKTGYTLKGFLWFVGTTEWSLCTPHGSREKSNVYKHSSTP